MIPYLYEMNSLEMSNSGGFKINDMGLIEKKHEAPRTVLNDIHYY